VENISIDRKERKYIKKKAVGIDDQWPELNGLLFHEREMSFTPPFPSCLPKALAQLNEDI